jgi:very-short-patch-repair endonuclease
MREKGWSTMKDLRKELRHERVTPAEEILWERLEGKKLNGLKFRRQHGVGHYVVDFYHPQSMTVIELDGAVHDDLEVKKNDRMREEFLIERGYKVIRFENEAVYSDIDTVLNKIILSVTSEM